MSLTFFGRRVFAWNEIHCHDLFLSGKLLEQTIQLRLLSVAQEISPKNYSDVWTWLEYQLRYALVSGLTDRLIVGFCFFVSIVGSWVHTTCFADNLTWNIIELHHSHTSFFITHARNHQPYFCINYDIVCCDDGNWIFFWLKIHDSFSFFVRFWNASRGIFTLNVD